MNSPNRRQQWREYHHKLKATLTPEQLEARRVAKAEYDKKYRADNAEKRRQARKAYAPRAKVKQYEWYHRCRAKPRILVPAEVQKENRRKYWLANKEAIKQMGLKWRKSNAELLREKGKAYRDAHRDVIQKRKKLYWKRRKEADPFIKVMFEGVLAAFSEGLYHAQGALPCWVAIAST